MKNSKIFNNKKFEDNLGYSIDKIMNLFDRYSQARLPYERMWKLLDAYDTGEFWKYVAKVMPSYSIRPDSNWVNWVKENYVNSLYVGSYRGDVFCREVEHEDITLVINEFIEYVFNKMKFQHIQHNIGERAALLNLGAVEFGWNSEIISGPKAKLFTGDIEVKPLDNLSVFLDPSVKDYTLGEAIFIAEEVPLVELQGIATFRERMDYFFRNIKDTDEYKSSLSIREYGKGYYGQRRNPDDNTVRLLTCYYKVYDKSTKDYRLDKIWIMEDGFVLAIKKGIKPKEFPVKVLYCNKPTKDPYGIPKTKLILNNAITINLLDSIDSTMVFKALNRGKIISRRAGINEPAFAKDGDNPSKLWIVDGDPNNVVRYVDLPDLPNDRHLLKQRLEQAIMRVTGIDDVYTGTDTNSVQTTGGMDLLNQRVTLRDNSRIANLQKFILECTEYVLMSFLENSKEVSYPKYNQYHETEDVASINFEQLRADQVKFDFTCDVTPNLPNNIQRRAETVNIIMEKQMQYQFNPPLITAEDWLRMQDFPDKYKMLQRIRAQRMADDVEDIESELINYSGLVGKGVRPDQAVKMLASERQFKRDNPQSGLGNTGNSGSFQNKQSG
jgi:hypothetical protein